MRNNFIQLWGIPILLAILTMAGLLLALVKTGIWHWVAWLFLTIPIILMTKHLYNAYFRK